MRVLHVTSGNLYGGIETFLVTLAELSALAPGMDSEFAYCFDGRLANELKARNATVHSLGEVQTRYPWTVLRGRRALTRLLGAGNYDVVVCHSTWPQAVFGPAVHRARVPLVQYVHGAGTGRHWLDRWAGSVIPDLILCNSRYTQTMIAGRYPKVPNEVLYLPVTRPPVFTPGERLETRTKLQTPHDAVVIVQVSRMEAWKGQALHLEALAQLPLEPNWIAWIVGGGQRPTEYEYLTMLKEKAHSLGIAERLRFTGQRNDVPRLLAAADVFCQPNLTPEPFGISYVEALYAGLPAVATAHGGALEIVDKSCGILVPAERGALSGALLQLTQDAKLRDRLAGGGPVRAEQLCAPERQMKALEFSLSAMLQKPVEAFGDLRPA